MKTTGVVHVLAALAVAGCGVAGAPAPGYQPDFRNVLVEREAEAEEVEVDEEEQPARPEPVKAAPRADTGKTAADDAGVLPVAAGVTGPAAVTFVKQLKVKDPELAGRLDHLASRVRKLSPARLAALKYMRWNPHRYDSKAQTKERLDRWLADPLTFANSLEMDLELVEGTTKENIEKMASNLPDYVRI